MGNTIRVFRNAAEAEAFAKKVSGNCVLTTGYRITESGKEIPLPDEWWVDYDDPDYKW